MTDDAFLHWLAGFIDGEGCFAIKPANNGRGHFSCWQSIKLRADDEDILREICERTGLGSVSRPRIDHGRAEINGSPSLRWVVATKQDCARLVCILDGHPLRAKKARDFAIWRQAVSVWCRVERANPRSPALKLSQNARLWVEMARLREELRLLRVYSDAADVFPKVVSSDLDAALF
jgi:hypothetical protein